MTKDEINRGVDRYNRALMLASDRLAEERESVVRVARLVAFEGAPVIDLRHAIQAMDAAIAYRTSVAAARRAFLSRCAKAGWGREAQP